MCYNVSHYYIGFCTECCSRSMRVVRVQTACQIKPRIAGTINTNPETGWYGADTFVATELCAGGQNYSKPEIVYKMIPTENHNLEHFCTRCYSEEEFQKFVDWWTKGQQALIHPDLTAYLSQAPRYLAHDQWRRRTLDPQIVRHRSVESTDATGGIRWSISMSPRNAKEILLLAAQRREGQERKDMSEFLKDDTHTFPTWFFNDPNFPLPDAEYDSVLYPSLDTTDILQFDSGFYGPHTLFDNPVWLPQDYRIIPNPDDSFWQHVERTYTARQEQIMRLYDLGPL